MVPLTPGDVNVLIVDDEDVMRNLFTDLLQDRGYKVSTAVNGEDACEKAGSEFFDIVFIDVHMPVMDGLQTLREMKRLTPRTVVVMMDSFPDILLDKATQEGAVKCIHKPFNIQEVIEVVENSLSNK